MMEEGLILSGFGLNSTTCQSWPVRITHLTLTKGDTKHLGGRDNYCWGWAIWQKYHITLFFMQDHDPHSYHDGWVGKTK